MRNSPLVIWVDASALVKWFVPEAGSEVVSKLLESTGSHATKLTTVVQYAETYSVLVRRRNAGDIATHHFDDAIIALESSVLSDEDFLLLSVDDVCYLEGLSLVNRYHLNCVDAACLWCVLRFLRQYPSQCLTLSSDRRLLRAAKEEGLSTVDPQFTSIEEIEAALREWM